MTPRRQFNSNAALPSEAPLPFSNAKTVSGKSGNRASKRSDAPRDPASEVLAAFANVSRRIHDLARELKCLGYFDDENDRPRAA